MLLFSGCVAAHEGVVRMTGDGAYITGIEIKDAEPSYDYASGVVTLPSWLVGDELTFVLLHETCHAWQNRHRAGGENWLWFEPEGVTAAALGMSVEDAADACALHYMGTNIVPIPADRRDSGYAVGALPHDWLLWAADVLP